MIRPRWFFAAVLALYGLAATPGPRARPAPVQIGVRPIDMRLARRP